MRDTHVHCCEDFRGCRAGKMAGDITFVNEADIGFLSAVSLPNLSQALLDNFLDLDSEHESEDDSEDEWSDFSDLSSGNDSSDMSGEESPSRGQKDVRRKKVPKARNKQGNESSKEKRKKSSGKYLSNDDVKRLEETLKSYVLSAQTHCENELRNEKSLSIFPVRKQMVSTLLNSDTIRVMLVKLCRDIYSKIIKAFTEISSAKVKNSDKRASFSVICSQLLLTVEESEVWRNMKKIIVTTIQLQENETDEVNFHAAVVLNTIYWALYENFHSAVMQIKIDSDKRKTQTNASEGADTVVDSDFVDVARVSGAALHKLRKGREKIVNGRKGARRVSEATKENYAAEVKIMSEMVCSAEEKTSLPLGLKRLDEGKLTFFNSKFTVVLLTLDKRIREMLTEKNLKRYPKNLMKLTKQSVALDEELQELFLAASKRACTAPFEEIRACSIWQELVKRICNTRFKEFYSAQEEKKLIQEGKVVSADQSLRDKLKTYSVDKRT